MRGLHTCYDLSAFVLQSDLVDYLRTVDGDGMEVVMADKTVKLNETQLRMVRAGLMQLKKSYERAVVKAQSEEKPEMAEVLRRQVTELAAVAMLF